MVDWIIDGQPYEPPESAAAEGYAQTPPVSGAGALGESAIESFKGIFQKYEQDSDIFNTGIQAEGEQHWPPHLQTGPATEQTPHDAEQLSPADYNEQYAPRGPDGKPVSIGDKPMSRGMAQQIGKQRTDEMETNAKLERAGAWGSWPAKFGTDMAVGLLDPMNTALGIVPGIGEGVILSNLLNAGASGVVARMGARIGSGALTMGAMGVPLTALQAAEAHNAGQDYGWRDALRDVALQAAMGAAFHGVPGIIRESGLAPKMFPPDRLMTGEHEAAFQSPWQNPWERPAPPPPPMGGTPEAMALVPEAAYAPERREALEQHFAANPTDHAPLRELGFSEAEVRGLQADGLAQSEGVMTPDQFEAWQQEFEQKHPAEETPEHKAAVAESAREALDQPPQVRLGAMQAGIAQVMDGRPVDVQPVIDAAEAGKPAEEARPVAGMTVGDIMDRYKVGRAEAKRKQDAYIESIGRPISEEERAARAAGVRASPADVADRQKDLRRNGYVTGVPEHDLRETTEAIYAPKPEEEARAKEAKTAATAEREETAKPATEGAVAPEAKPAVARPIRSIDQIIAEEKVSPKRAAEIQTEEIVTRGKPVEAEDVEARKARIDALPPAHREAARIGEAAGVEDSADKTPEQVYAEVAEKLPTEQVVEHVEAQAEGQSSIVQQADDAADAVAAIEAANRFTGGKAKIESYDAADDVFRVVFEDGVEERVFGYTLGRLIRAAIEPGRTAWNLNHEVIHVLRQLAVFKPEEWDLLVREAEAQDWVKKNDIEAKWAGLSREQQIEEAIAEEFAQRTTQPLTPEVRDAVQSGLDAAHTVFEAIKSGEIGAREEGPGAPTLAESEEAARKFDQSKRALTEGGQIADEEIEREVQQANSTPPVVEGEGAGGEPKPATGGEGPVPAERGPRAGGAGAGGRPGPEAGGRPGGAAAGNEPGAGAAGATERPKDANGNLIFEKAAKPDPEMEAAERELAGMDIDPEDRAAIIDATREEHRARGEAAAADEAARCLKDGA